MRYNRWDRENVALSSSQVPWAKIVAFRNFVVHEYFGLDWPIVWDTATILVPDLRTQITAILQVEFPESARSD